MTNVTLRRAGTTAWPPLPPPKQRFFAASRPAVRPVGKDEQRLQEERLARAALPATAHRTAHANARPRRSPSATGGRPRPASVARVARAADGARSGRRCVAPRRPPARRSAADRGRDPALPDRADGPERAGNDRRRGPGPRGDQPLRRPARPAGPLGDRRRRLRLADLRPPGRTPDPRGAGGRDLRLPHERQPQGRAARGGDRQSPACLSHGVRGARAVAQRRVHGRLAQPADHSGGAVVPRDARRGGSSWWARTTSGRTASTRS